jgi:inosine-uridine nucleoside N-ribohydrolase
MIIKKQQIMKKNIFIIFALSLFTVFAGTAQVKIIFDTDHGGDADDLGALVMLHNLHNRGECELLAVMSWTNEQYVIPAMDALNRYYGNPDIPLGVRSHVSHFTDWNYNKPIADALPWELKNSDVPLAVDLYRKILSEHDDNSITIVTVGPLKNIQDLLMSGPDRYSKLSGKELIEKKVEKFVIMGGRFPSGDWEWNFSGNMPGVTRYVLENLTVPVVFSGYEIGLVVHTGPRFHELDPDHPLFVGYMYFSKHAEWMQDRYREGRITPNASYDQTAVLYAVRGGVGKYWDKVENGYCVADDTGGNVWVETQQPTNHAYLVLKIRPEEMAQIIYSLKLEDVVSR